MPKHVKRIECCYCGASSLVDLGNSHAMSLVCSGCSARMSVDKLTVLSTGTPSDPPVIRREVRFEPPPSPPKHQAYRDFDDDDDDDDDDRRRRPRRKKRRTFLKRLEDIWDEIEDIID